MAVALEVILKRSELMKISTPNEKRCGRQSEGALVQAWYAERDLYGTGVVVSTHPWETMDNSGAWIEALKNPIR